jgi:hypothetical protein
MLSLTSLVAQSIYRLDCLQVEQPRNRGLISDEVRYFVAFLPRRDQLWGPWCLVANNKVSVLRTDAFKTQDVPLVLLPVTG